MHPKRLGAEYSCRAYPFEKRIVLLLRYLAVTATKVSEAYPAIWGVFLVWDGQNPIPLQLLELRKTLQSHPFWRSSSSSLQPAQAFLRFHKSRSCGHTASASSLSGSLSHGLETSNLCSSSSSINNSITKVVSGRPPILIKRWSWFRVQP